MTTKTYAPHTRVAPDQLSARQQLYDLFGRRPLPDDELLINLGLYMRASAFAKLLFLDEIYRRILPLPGVAMVFGAWWGQDVVALHNLRAVHEPYNNLRKVIAFDTFTGYPAPSGRDQTSDTIKEGGYHVVDGYENYLDSLLHYHNRENPFSHLVRHELVKGDVAQTIHQYLETHPETMVALAYLDLALYEPTKEVLRALLPVLVPGGYIVMDELNTPEYPGETQAFREVFAGVRYEMTRSSILPDRTLVRVLGA